MEKDFTGFQRLSDRQVKGVGTDLGAVIIKDLILKGKDKRYAESLRKLIIREWATNGKNHGGKPSRENIVECIQYPRTTRKASDPVWLVLW